MDEIYIITRLGCFEKIFSRCYVECIGFDKCNKYDPCKVEEYVGFPCTNGNKRIEEILNFRELEN